MSTAPKNDKPTRGARQAIALGTNLVAGMLVCAGLGYYIDLKTGGGHGWTLGGMFLGLAYCFYEVWKVVRQIRREDRK